MINTYAVIKTSDVKELDANQTVIAISRTDGKKGKSGLCAVIDSFSELEFQALTLDATGKAWIVDQINALQSRMASDLNKNGKPLNHLNLGYGAIIRAMELENQSQRMTKEAIGAWFDSDMVPVMSEKLKEKYINVGEDKLAKMIAPYKDKFQSLAGREVSMTEAVKNQLFAAIALLGDDYDNVIGNKVIAKLSEVQEATETLAAL